MSQASNTWTEASDKTRQAFTAALDRFMRISTEGVYKDPVHVGERVVIAVASIRFAGGFGFGGGTDASSNTGEGGGSGGLTEARPVAIVEAGADGVRVHPVIDLTHVGLTLIAAALTVWRTTRR
jgi:uncharacterized spore protein YtfJ